MLKKNNFFYRKLVSFKKKTAIILENKESLTYNELLLHTEKISRKLQTKKN